MNMNNCTNCTVFRLLESLIYQNNLYLISEAHDISLAEHMSYLVKSNCKNGMIPILLVNDLLQILKSIYS